MKVSSDKVAEHRAALLKTAKRLLQERGFDGTAVAEISREAGLTQGALYGQFKSKDALAAEAIRQSFAEGAAIWGELRDGGPDSLSALLDAYLCETHAERSGYGLRSGGLRVGDRATGPGDRCGVRRRVSRELETSCSRCCRPAPPDEAQSPRDCAAFGHGRRLAIARALEKADPELSRDVLSAAREELKRLAFAPRSAPEAG